MKDENADFVVMLKYWGSFFVIPIRVKTSEGCIKMK